MSHKHSTFFLVTIALLSFHLPAAARVTCCEVDGKRVCGDPAPPQCTSRAKTVFGKGGVTQTVEAPLTTEQRAAREAEEARKKEEEKRAQEQARRDRALLDSYASEKDFDRARDRAITAAEKNGEQLKLRLDAALKKKDQLAKEKEFYEKKPLPAKLQAQIKDNESEIAAQQKALEEKDTNIAAIRERFDAEKARYLELKGRQSDVRKR